MSENRRELRAQGDAEARAIAVERERSLGVLQSDAFWATIMEALPGQLRENEMFRQAAMAAILAEPKLIKADKRSLTLALLYAAKLGLIPGPGFGEIALFVDKSNQVQHRTMYGGMLKLVRQSGMVADIDAQAVYENDDCHIRVGKMPRHEIALGPRGKLLGCYAYARLHGSDHVMVEYMDWDSIWAHALKYSDALAGDRQTPWRDKEAKGEMGCKTVLHRLMKMQPKSVAVAQVLAEDDVEHRMRDVSPQEGEPRATIPFASQVRPQSHGGLSEPPPTYAAKLPTETYRPAQDVSDIDPSPQGAAQATTAPPPDQHTADAPAPAGAAPGYAYVWQSRGFEKLGSRIRAEIEAAVAQDRKAAITHMNADLVAHPVVSGLLKQAEGREQMEAAEDDGSEGEELTADPPSYVIVSSAGSSLGVRTDPEMALGALEGQFGREPPAHVGALLERNAKVIRRILDARPDLHERIQALYPDPEEEGTGYA